MVSESEETFLYFLRTFLTDKELCVRGGTCHSEYIKQEKEVPQGSMLRVTFFAMAINNIIKQLSYDVQHALYADDFTIFVTARNDTHSSRFIQFSVNNIWTNSKSVKFSSGSKI